MWTTYKTSIVIATSLVILLSLFWFFQSFALVIFISILLTVLLNSSVDKLEAKKVPRLLATAIILFTFLALIMCFFGVVSSTFLPALSKFISDIPEIANSIKTLPVMNHSAYIAEQLDQLFNGFASFSVTALKSSVTILVGIFSKFLDLIIMIFVTFYLLKDGKQIKNFFVMLFPQKDHSRVFALLNQMIVALGSYIRGQLAVCVITGIFVFFYFTFADLPYAPVFAVLSAVGEFIPVVGPTIASIAGSLLAATTSPAMGIQTLLFYVILTQANHNIIYPYLIGKSLNLHPIAIMLGILFGGELLGPVGMFLAVPCMVIMKLVIEDIATH